MLHAARHDEELARLEVDDPVAQLHTQVASYHEKHLVLVLVVVPHEGPQELHDLHVLAVQLTDDPGHVVVVVEGQFLRDVDLFHSYRSSRVMA